MAPFASLRVTRRGGSTAGEAESVFALPVSQVTGATVALLP